VLESTTLFSEITTPYLSSTGPVSEIITPAQVTTTPGLETTTLVFLKIVKDTFVIVIMMVVTIQKSLTHYIVIKIVIKHVIMTVKNVVVMMENMLTNT
jgi:hypothetical protein